MYHIMTINMKGKQQLNADKRRKQIISNITVPRRPSIIFCQNPPGHFKKKVVEECGSDSDYSYKFAPESITAKNHVAVMWNEIDFKGDEVKCTDPSIEEILEFRERAAMVKLTSKKTGESFLAVSWHGPFQKTGPDDKIKVLHGLICFLLEVCEKEALSSFIIGGDFNLNTSEVNLTEYFGLTMLSYNTQHKKGSIPYKDTFIVWVKVGSDKRPLIASSVKPHKSENGSSEASPLDHKPIVGDLKILNKEPSIKQDKAETSTEDKTTNENDIPGLTPEKTPPTAGGSYAPSAQRKLKYEVRPPLQANEGASSSTNGQSPSASHDGYVTKKDFDRLMSLVETLRTSVDSLHKKIDRQTDEIAEIKSAMQRPDIPPRSVSPAQHAGPNSQTSKVLPSPNLDEGSDKESASEIKKKESRIKKK